MRLPQPFIKLPLAFGHARLAEEINQFDDSEWRAHPQRFSGNSSLILVSTNGQDNDDFAAPMVPNARLGKSPYIRQVMASFNTVIGRSRLMRLEPGAIVGEHTDSHYFWRNHLRIHVPILTEPDVVFNCGDTQVHMAAGESWTFNNWLPHSVENRSDKVRIHLVIDTVGSSSLWHMIDQNGSDPLHIAYNSEFDPDLKFESFPGLAVLPTCELRAELTRLTDEIVPSATGDGTLIDQFRSSTVDFIRDWESLWVATGPTVAGFDHFKRLLAEYRSRADTLPDHLSLSSNGRPAKEAIWYTLDAALAQQNLHDSGTGGTTSSPRPRFDRPVFIVAAPRSGSTLLFESLLPNRELWSVGDEAHKHFESIPGLRPNKDNQSNRLTAEHATRDAIDTVLNSLSADLVNCDGLLHRDLSVSSRPIDIRFLEKTPKNALRIPFILKAFPDARFIFLFREARQNISSLLDSWRSQRFVTYPKLPGWTSSYRWSHLLISGWQDLVNSTLAEIVTRQWSVTNQTILDDLQQLPRERWCAIEYDDFLNNTPQEMQRLCDFSHLIFGPRMAEVASKPLRLSKYTLSDPHPQKWQKNAAELKEYLPSTTALMGELRRLVSPSS